MVEDLLLQWLIWFQCDAPFLKLAMCCGFLKQISKYAVNCIQPVMNCGDSVITHYMYGPPCIRLLEQQKLSMVIQESDSKREMPGLKSSIHSHFVPLWQLCPSEFVNMAVSYRGCFVSQQLVDATLLSVCRLISHHPHPHCGTNGCPVDCCGSAGNTGSSWHSAIIW